MLILILVQLDKLMKDFHQYKENDGGRIPASDYEFIIKLFLKKYLTAHEPLPSGAFSVHF